MKDLLEMVRELQLSNKSSHKKEVLWRYPQNKRYLSIIYNPFKQFNITSSNILKLKGKLEDKDYQTVHSLDELLTILSNREVTGHTAIRTAQVFIEQNPDFEELILSAIDKNLKCRVEAASINDVFPNCVPTFNVVLAKDYNKIPDSVKPDFTKQKWYCSRKMDGARCICIKKNDDIRFYSRSGKEFTTLEKVKDEIALLPIKEGVFDGEICLFNNGNEDFQGIMKEIRKKDHVVENPIYKIFDFLTIEEFETGIGTIPLSERLDALDNAIPPFFSSDILHIMPQGIVSNMEQVELGLKVANEKGWEGLMIRKDVPYEGKRTNNLLKIKSFYDDEYEVLDIVICNMRFAIGGTEVEEEVLNSAIIEHKGHRVNVGSGWTIEQRRRFKENPSEIIGKTITVQYFEETHNQDGGISLRFPTVKAIYNNDRDI